MKTVSDICNDDVDLNFDSYIDNADAVPTFFIDGDSKIVVRSYTIDPKLSMKN